MDGQAAMLDRILNHLPIGQRSRNVVTEETTLAEFGVASLHLISLLLELQREFGLDSDALMEADMPTTVGELVALIQKHQPQQ